MTLLQLQYFKTLAKVLHYTQAAKELHIAQPSLSYSISELEKELGVKLFDRAGNRITLNAQGKIFLKYVRFLDAFCEYISEGVLGTATVDSLKGGCV